MTTTVTSRTPGGHPAPTNATSPRPPRPGPPPAPPRSWPGWLPEVSLAMVGVVSALAFGRVYRGDGWQGSAVAPLLSALLVGGVARRLVRSRPAALSIASVAVVAVVTWTVLPGTTTAGLPLVQTWRAAGRVLAGFGSQFEASVPPVEPTRAFLLATAIGVGAAGVAMAGLQASGSRRARAWAPAPALAVFLAACVLGGPAGRVVSMVVLVLALGVHLLVEQAAANAERSLWIGGVEAPPTQRPGRAGFRILVLAAVTAAVVSGLPGPDGNGPIGWKTLGGGGSTRIIVSPMVSISTRLEPHNAKADVFSVTSTAPAYWQLTTLDVYSGSTWQAGRAPYRSFSARLPTGTGKRRAPKGTREVVEKFHIQALDSPWLPSAFDPIAVKGASDVQYSAATGSLLSKHPTADGANYTVHALETVATLDATKLEAAPALRPGQEPPGQTSLPAAVPARVRALARGIVDSAHAHTEYAKALALQDFFYGRQFTYSLHPPVDGSGIDAIETFLFDTRTGYCQQYAGSYAVMARSLGLPTRMAVGFTTGRRIGPDRYQVTDADVHTWPEVWFPRYGWVPFEPTKGAPGSGFAIPGATAITGNTAAVSRPRARTAGGPGAASRQQTSPTTAAGSSGTTPSSPSRSADNPTRFHQIGRPGGPEQARGGNAGAAAKRTAHPAPGALAATSNLAWAGRAALALLALGAALVTANAAAGSLRRRRRRRRIRIAGPGSADAAWLQWQDIVETLASAGVRRKPWESTPRFATRAGWALDPTGRLARELAAAAAAIDSVAWAEPSAVGGAAPDLAGTAAEVHRRVARRRRNRDRVRLALDITRAWRPAPLDRDSAEVPPPPDAPSLVALPDPEPVGAGRR